MTEMKRDSGPNALRRGRVSVAQATYFVTVCIEPRCALLTDDAAVAIMNELRRMDELRLWALRCATVMPDHIHFVVTLGERLPLSRSVARLKFATRRVLAERGARWQENLYDHRLRPSDSLEATLRYVWLNPYALGLIESPAAWPHFYCSRDDWLWFEPRTDVGLPFPEWLR